jgi:hypothetical protein
LITIKIAPVDMFHPREIEVNNQDAKANIEVDKWKTH